MPFLSSQKLPVSGPSELSPFLEEGHNGSYQVRESLDELLVNICEPKESLHPTYTEGRLHLAMAETL